jgi:hypothetical protein
MIFLSIGFSIADSKYTGVQIAVNMWLNLLALIFVGSIKA